MLLNLRKEGNPAIWDDLDEPGRHYAKWNKAVTGQILYDIIYIKSLK